MTQKVPGMPESQIPRELSGLRLAAADLQALAHQGFVVGELRRGKGPYYKLRWRRGPQQCVRYLGSDPERAQRIQWALETLQRPVRQARQLAQLLAQVRTSLRQLKDDLLPHAQSLGGSYHGYTLRRSQAHRSKDHKTVPRPERITPLSHSAKSQGEPKS